MGVINNFTVQPKESIVSNEIPTTDNTTIEPLETTEGSFFILIPLLLFLGILLLSYFVYLMSRNRRSLKHIYCKKRLAKHMQKYNKDDYGAPWNGEQDNVQEQVYEEEVEEEEEEEEEDKAMDNDDVDNPTRSLLKGKLQINNRYENYLSTSQLNRSADLFA